MEKNIKIYWLVLIVITVVAIFIFIQTAQDDADLVQYFSFAGSITSLVLGLIAIFYSIISNQQSTENFGKLKEAVTKIEDGAATVKNISDNINRRLDKISDDLIKFGTKADKNQTVLTSELGSEVPIQKDDTADLPDEGNDNGEMEDGNG